ncbi:hypothetical protein BG004_006236 [Podila humilis]|nr:hypothetical protein BG004_006236 [Podila humilis]
MMASNEHTLVEAQDQDGAPFPEHQPSPSSSSVQGMTFRPHHLKTQELKHTDSFSSMSSYASSFQSNNPPHSTGTTFDPQSLLSSEDKHDLINTTTAITTTTTTIATATIATATITTATSASSTTSPDQTTKHRTRPGGGTLLRPAGKAHDWYSGGRITSHGRWFRDSQSRTLLLRGVNLCGNSKLPTTPNGSSHLSDGFFDHRNVCFLGRPFPRDQADEHFSRLKSWGLTFVRLLVPWEALEHSGPSSVACGVFVRKNIDHGCTESTLFALSLVLALTDFGFMSLPICRSGIYDEKFIDSLIELIELMPKYGIKCFIDPHQDCWSRFSGGSGAPGWTFEAAGLDLTKFKTTGAAYVHNTNQFPGDSPPMVWPTNYTKLAASTMFTLFWAGDTFAPKKMYQGEPIQQFLQNRYLECYKHLAKRLSHLDAIVGFEVMNEPHPGYVGLKNLKRYDFNSNLFFGDSPSSLESMALGDGMELPIEVWVKSWPFPTKKQRTRMVNTQKESAWLEGECLWKQHGVWNVHPKTGKPHLVRPDYFTTDPMTGDKIDFTTFYLDFVNKYSRAIQSVLPSAFIFVGPIPNEPAPVWGPGDHEENIVYAPHWYDLHSIFNKAFDGKVTHDVQGLSKGKNVFSATYFGLKGAKKNYRGQLSNVLNIGLKNVGTKPCLIGECGIPMDINQRQAFLSGDYQHHSKFLDAVISAMESNLLSFTLWNYNTTNDNTHGDHWNGEDFSIFSLDSPLPSPSPSVSGRGSPALDAQPRSSRQQAPNFAREVRKRAAASSAFALQGHGQDGSIISEDRASSPETFGSDDRTSLQEDELDSIMNEGPFDRSYFSYEHEESNDGPDHAAHVGGRALDAIVRPYAAKVAGEPLSSEFDFTTLQYTFRFSNYVQTPVPIVHVSTPEQLSRGFISPSTDTMDTSTASAILETNEGALGRSGDNGQWFGHPPENTSIAFETEIFVPAYHYDDAGLEIQVSDGDWRYVKERQTLYYRHKDTKPGAVHSVRIKPVLGRLTTTTTRGVSITAFTKNGSSQSLLRPPTQHPRDRSCLSMNESEIVGESLAESLDGIDSNAVPTVKSEGAQGNSTGISCCVM